MAAATAPEWHAVDSIGVEQLAGSITGWQQVYDQISPGRFQGALTELLLGPAQLFIESSSHALVQIYTTWPQAVWFGIPAHDDHVGRIEGTRIERGMLAVRTGRSDFQLSNPPASPRAWPPRTRWPRPPTCRSSSPRASAPASTS